MTQRWILEESTIYTQNHQLSESDINPSPSLLNHVIKYDHVMLLSRGHIILIVTKTLKNEI